MALISKSLSTKAKKRVAARNVFRPNGKTRRALTARIVGRYMPLGANSWDDYTFVAEDGETISVFPTVRIQLEPTGARFRMRRRGTVVVADWIPTPEEKQALGDSADHRAAFLKDYIASAANKPGFGAGAFIAKTLNR